MVYCVFIAIWGRGARMGSCKGCERARQNAGLPLWPVVGRLRGNSWQGMKVHE